MLFDFNKVYHFNESNNIFDESDEMLTPTEQKAYNLFFSFMLHIKIRETLRKKKFRYFDFDDCAHLLLFEHHFFPKP